MILIKEADIINMNNDERKNKLNVLFVGNSYTYYNDMPSAYFAPMAEECGYEAEVMSITRGGYRLCQFADPCNEEGARLRRETDGKHFDFAVLQEHSVNPIKDEDGFIKAVGDVASLISADKFILYATWGRNDGSETLDQLGLTREEMTAKLSEAYNKAADKYGMQVAEVGKAFLERSRSGNTDELYDPDKSHPSAIGSEIAARVILERING